MTRKRDGKTSQAGRREAYASDTDEPLQDRPHIQRGRESSGESVKLNQRKDRGPGDFQVTRTRLFLW